MEVRRIDMHASPADALDQAPRSGAVEDNPEGSRYIQISDTLAKVLANQIRDRVTFLLEASNAELARRRGFEAEANQSHCDVLLLRAECHRLRELNGILSAFVEECHANGGEDVPGEIREAMDAVFPPDVAVMDSTRVQAKPEAPATECACPEALTGAFEASHYARHDHKYSGIEILMWLRDYVCPCAGLRKELEKANRWNQNDERELAAANERAESLEMARDLAQDAALRWEKSAYAAIGQRDAARKGFAEAVEILRYFAAKNPVWSHAVRGPQDPHRVHAIIARFDAQDLPAGSR